MPFQKYVTTFLICIARSQIAYSEYIHLKYGHMLGVPIVAQQKQIRLGTMRLRVQPLASLSVLRIRCCHELWYRSQTRLGSCVAVALV